MTNRHVSRMDTLRHLFNGHQVKEFWALSSLATHKVGVLVGVQSALAMLITLPAVYYSEWSHLVGFASLGTLAGIFGRFAPAGQRGMIMAKALGFLLVSISAMSAALWAGASMVQLLLLLSVLCGLLYFGAATARTGIPGPLIFVFAASASMSTAPDLSGIAERLVATTLAWIVTLVICLVSEPIRLKLGADRMVPAETVPPLKLRIHATLRVTLAAGLAAFIAWGFGANYPGWAALGAMAVLQATQLNAAMNRAAQRALGTLIGSGLIWLILSTQPSPLVVIGILALVAIIIETVIAVNYAVAQVFVTPLSLLMTYLGSQQSAGIAMVPERVTDTLIGTAIGMAIAIILSTLADRQSHAHHHANRTGDV